MATNNSFDDSDFRYRKCRKCEIRGSLGKTAFKRVFYFEEKIMKVYINGKYYEKDDAKVSVFDHGFLYGDGIFEGIRLYSGNVF